MLWLLDTNIVIAISKQASALLPQLERRAARDVVLSTVVLAEIEYGIAKSARREYNRRVFDAIVQGFEVLPFDAAAASRYGDVRAALEQQGQPIGPNDLMIAAHALALDATLVTDNVREFTRVDGLQVENWLR